MDAFPEPRMAAAGPSQLPFAVQYIGRWLWATIQGASDRFAFAASRSALSHAYCAAIVAASAPAQTTSPFSATTCVRP